MQYFYKETMQLGVDSLRTVNPFLIALYTRLINISENEPVLDGAAYEKWEDQQNSLQGLIDSFEELKTKFDRGDDEKELEQQLNHCKHKTLMHQMEYGGLKRLRM